MKVQQIISYRFLDCLIKRDNEGRLQTKVYRKKTHRTMHALHIRSTGTCKSKYHKDTGEKSKNCFNLSLQKKL